MSTASLAPGAAGSFWRSPRGALALTALLTLLAGLENLAPWAPFYVVYAVLASWLGWRLRARRAGTLRLRPWHWIVAVLCGIAFQFVGAAILGIVGPLLGGGVEGSSTLLLDALQRVAARAATAWHVDSGHVLVAYLTFLLVWAGFGEEAFYRGYVHGTLQPRFGFWPAALVSAALFGGRHATQLVAVRPYPWAACVVWVLLGTLFGLVLSALYSRTRSLGPPIVAHYVFNLVPAISTLAG